MAVRAEVTSFKQNIEPPHVETSELILVDQEAGEEEEVHQTEAS